MSCIPLGDVERVEFFKRNELTTDLICCTIVFGDGGKLFLHEEMPDWQNKIESLAELDGFDQDWFAKVSQPPFAASNHVAFCLAA